MQEFLDDKLAREIRDHALNEFPKEACGIIIKSLGQLQYIPCKNIYDKPEESFIIDPNDYLRAIKQGELKYIFHSHPNSSCEPSITDLAECEKSGIPWIIMELPSQKIKTIYPKGFILPLEGRQFIHGINDCYSLIRDYYKQELNIDIPDYARVDNWWEQGENLYLDNYEQAGFEKVEAGLEDLQIHDVILMQFFSNIVNHGAVYVGDNNILHHVYKRLSRKEVYNDYWRKRTVCVVRHKSLS